MTVFLTSRQWRALLDGAGGITLFPDSARPMGSFDLHAWRMAGMTAMFLLLVTCLAATVWLTLAGAADGWALLPWLACMAVFAWIQVRHARVPDA